MKRLWILNHYAQEPGAGGGTRHYDLAKRLPQHGWRASIIAAGTEHNSGRQRLENAAHRLDEIDGVDFLWIGTPTYAGNGFSRLRNMLSYAFKASRPRYTRSLAAPDAVIGSSVHPFAGLAGLHLARKFKVPFFFEVRDLWPETLIDMGAMSRNGLPAMAFRAIERKLYREAEKIITPLPLAHEYITPMGVPREKVVWLPNGSDFDRFSKIDLPPVRAPFTLMYFGAHGPANGLENVIDAMRLVGNGGIRLRLIGDGPSKQALIKYADGLNSVSFEPPVPKTEIPKVAAEADAFVFNLIAAPVFRFGISPNKLSDFMASARPVIFACDASNNPAEEANAGFTVPPSHPRKLADAIAQMAGTSLEERHQMGINGRRYVEEHHNFDRLAERLADILKAGER